MRYACSRAGNAGPQAGRQGRACLPRSSAILLQAGSPGLRYLSTADSPASKRFNKNCSVLIIRRVALGPLGSTTESDSGLGAHACWGVQWRKGKQACLAKIVDKRAEDVHAWYVGSCSGHRTQLQPTETI